MSNEKKILNVYIPVKDRNISQINRCISYIKKGKVADKIILIDYGSKVPIKPIEGVIIERVDLSTWNKAHALNLGILKYPSDFIMTVDVDMLISPIHFAKILRHLSINTFIYDTNVRRIEAKDLDKDYDKSIDKSYPWRNQDINQLFNTANGGFQVYSREFYNKMNGIQEGLGLYHGAVDNVIYYRARMFGLNTIDISYPLLHVEHKKQKEENYDESERQVAKGYRTFKASYLNHMIRNNIAINPETFGKKTPNMDMFYEYKKLIATQNDLVQEALKKGKEEVTIGYETYKIEKKKPSVLLAVINNYGLVPDYFMYDVMRLIEYTRAAGYEVDLQKVVATDVNSLRNVAVKTSLGMNNEKKTYTYFMALDDDHRYPPEFLVRFLQLSEKFDLPIITGLTPRKVAPYKNTQYYKDQENFQEESNIVDCPKPVNKLIDIEVSGPVGMLIKTDVFKTVPYPWYQMQFSKKKVKVKDKDDKEVEKEVDYQMGGDIFFCKQLKKYKIPIKCDLAISFPHEIKKFANRGNEVGYI